MKKRLSPVTTALVLIVVLGVVLYAYTRGLLGRERRPAGEMMGGGGGGPAPEPPTGLPTVGVSTFAGYNRPGFSDGQGWDAQFNGPAGIAAAADGSLYVSDSRNHRIRRIGPDASVTTVAGWGPTDCLPGGFADGPADEARLFSPAGLAVASDGAIYFADAGNHRIRKVKDGVVTTVAGGFTERDELGFDQGGCRDGPAAQARFRFPAAVAVDPQGVLFVADLGNARLRRISPDGMVTTVTGAASWSEPAGVAIMPRAYLMVADPGAGAVQEMSAAAAFASRQRTGLVPQRPTGVCPMPGGIACVDAEWHVVYGLTPEKSVLLAGVLPPTPNLGFRDGTGDMSHFAGPCAVASVGSDLYVADFRNNCIRKLSIPDNWAAPPPPEPEGPGRNWPRRRERDGDRAADRGQRAVQNVPGRR